MAVTENFEASSIGKNIKRVGEELKIKKTFGIGTKVDVTGGTHKGLTGKVVAIGKSTSSAKGGECGMGAAAG